GSHGDPHFQDVERRIAAAGKDNELFISAITPWEIALGVRRERIEIAGDILAWIRDALDALSSSWHPWSRRSRATRSTWPGITRILRTASSWRPRGGSVLRWSPRTPRSSSSRKRLGRFASSRSERGQALALPSQGRAFLPTVIKPFGLHEGNSSQTPG